ncbi:hypothetical protein LEMLEM_LOCUS5013 [Lemmus lemmus]
MLSLQAQLFHILPTTSGRALFATQASAHFLGFSSSGRCRTNCVPWSKRLPCLLLMEQSRLYLP